MSKSELQQWRIVSQRRTHKDNCKGKDTEISFGFRRSWRTKYRYHSSQQYRDAQAGQEEEELSTSLTSERDKQFSNISPAPSDHSFKLEDNNRCTDTNLIL
ncbi:hypothetical protein Pst134EB_020296 [Puccinia striiformis f. sp. tritici]|nr:hypothetical protein Pst134EB_020296 [Puccinia striiformis f. sp. tritici]